MSIFLTSDEHYHHNNIIKYCERPFASIDEMDEALIERYNKVVKENDTVYHLGDFAFGEGSSNPEKYFNRLNGKQILIKGNHDAKPTLKLGWEAIYDLHEINYKHQKIVLCHYAMKTWNKSHADAFHAYGHSHNAQKEIADGSCDIGVDGWNYSPLSIEQFIERTKWKKDNFDIFLSDEYKSLSKSETCAKHREINSKFI